MTDLTKSINSFIALSAPQLKKGALKKGGYCIIVFATNPMNGGRNIILVYKDIDDFKKKVRKDSKKAGDSVIINFELWSFD